MEKISLGTIYPYLKLKVLAFITFLSLTINVFSQPYQDLSHDEKLELSTKLVQKTPFIFEGEIVDFKAFEGENGRIYTAIHVHTIHSYKDNIPIGKELKIIMKGGFLNGRIQGDNHSIGLSDFLGKKSKYIFFCKENDSFPIPQNSNNEQYYQFQIEELGAVIRDMNRIYGTDAWVGLYWLKFKNRDLMDDYLGKFEGLKIPVKKKVNPQKH